MHIDTNNQELRSVLVQLQGGVDRMIAYASRTVSKSELTIRRPKRSVSPWYRLLGGSSPISMGNHLASSEIITRCADWQASRIRLGASPAVSFDFNNIALPCRTRQGENMEKPTVYLEHQLNLPRQYLTTVTARFSELLVAR